MRLIESLEARRLMAWSTYATLIGQDTAATAYASLTGAGQTVAIIDTGIDYNHPDLGGGFGPGKKVVDGYDFIQNDANPMDTDGHGTTVAGFVAGKQFTYGGKTYRGIAPDAKLVALRVGTGRNNITDANIERAVKWVISNRVKHNITVVNISLGGGAYNEAFTNSTLSDDFKTLADAGVLVIAASGNEYTDGDGYPAADLNVFSVGSVTAADQVSDFSNRSSILDLLAPGEQVTSALRNGSGYTTVDGTSFASPITAGAAVLLRQAAPTLGIKDIASVLRTSSVSNVDGDGEIDPVTSRTYGRLDLVAAIKLAQARNGANLDVMTTTKHTTIDTEYDKSGILHLAYYDPATRKLLYSTRNQSGLWTTPVRVDNSNADLGQHLSLALDQTGKPAIAYFDSTNADLKYATLSGGTTWSTRVVDSKKSVGQFPSLAFDSVGDPVISYYLKSGGRLRVARAATPDAWTTTTVDGSADVGTYNSLAYLDDGAASIYAIAYADATNGNLKYARFTEASQSWETFVVHDTTGVGNIELSLANGQARIAYQDLRNADVCYAYRESSKWFTKTIASSGSLGKNIRTYFDTADQYHIVYYNLTKDGTYDATISDATQNVLSTDRVGTIGRTASIAVSPFGDVTLTGLNRAGKQMRAASIVDAV